MRPGFRQPGGANGADKRALGALGQNFVEMPEGRLLQIVKRDRNFSGVLQLFPTVIVKIARLFALQLFHLLGYRRHREDGDRLLVMARRAGDRL